jgi:hypothetical protein
MCGFPPSFSPLIANEAVGLSKDFVDDRLLGLLGSYTCMLSVSSIHARGGQPIGP